ncbi:hypothetical protein LEP1GSC050_2781 [Leptospira broomii serovar Hurstbridge str. 5399]|uniref:Uncharacterized protein n=2 Tax=Leptospira broomii TaxID=301541 RepID=T0FBE0_9LEPT|nr:hypothetical protein LEP1GSC050_2781 [Leptospira broomii serovar Hurstbridge str. 5399]
MYPGKRISRAIKNDLFIWRLISKLKFEKRETLRLREELKVLELELYNSKNSLILAKETISFYKECNKGIFESNSLLPHFKKKL